MAGAIANLAAFGPKEPCLGSERQCLAVRRTQNALVERALCIGSPRPCFDLAGKVL